MPKDLVSEHFAIVSLQASRSHALAKSDVMCCSGLPRIWARRGLGDGSQQGQSPFPLTDPEPPRVWPVSSAGQRPGARAGLRHLVDPGQTLFALFKTQCLQSFQGTRLGNPLAAALAP